MGGGRNNPKYVYDLPYFERMELCRILDQNDKWEELGGIYMHFDVLMIQTLRREILRGNSPTDQLLTLWGHQNHTILELFALLSKMQHYQAMLTIKQFVDPEHHRLINEGEQNLTRLFQSRSRKNVATPPAADKKEVASPTGSPGVLPSRSSDPRDNQSCNPSTHPGHAQDKVKADLKQDERSQERKILNNENQPQPGRSAPNKKEGDQKVLANKEENPGANDANDFLRPKPAKDESAKSKNITEISSSIVESIGILPVIDFKELETATNGWDENAILGKGGFGTVYKGMWKNTQVAIKRAKDSDTNENRNVKIQQMFGELKLLNSCRHDNILPLYGFSFVAEEPLLVYQYMPNGSLEDRLLCRHGTKPLTWFQRHNIATGTARGLQFLHTMGTKPLIHGDIKSANILLDSNFEPKIGDFGLAREGPYVQYTHMKVSKVHGTRPYLPDEFLRHKKFSTKVDTHSFGIVLFELATGLRAYDDQRNQKFLKDLVENSNDLELSALMDKKCGPDEHQTYPNLIVLGKRCASKKPKDRPEMVTVLNELNAMAVKRDATVEAQNLIEKNSLSPGNPFEMQVIYNHFGRQRKISPGSPLPTIHRAVSPQHVPEISITPSPVVNEIHPPFSHLDPARAENMYGKDIRSNSPGLNNNYLEQDRKTDVNPSQAVQTSQNTFGPKQITPVQPVTPPLNNTTSNATTDDITSDESETNLEYDYDLSSQLDNVLPLLSELGIKKSNRKTKENCEGSNEENLSHIQTTARKKHFWGNQTYKKIFSPRKFEYTVKGVQPRSTRVVKDGLLSPATITWEFCPVLFENQTKLNTRKAYGFPAQHETGYSKSAKENFRGIKPEEAIAENWDSTDLEPKCIKYSNWCALNQFKSDVNREPDVHNCKGSSSPRKQHFVRIFHSAGIVLWKQYPGGPPKI